MKPSVKEIRSALSNGLLSFPVTDMDEEGQFNAKTYVDRLTWCVDNQASAVFVAGGTGEFFSLSKAEYKEIVHLSTETIDGRVPVISSTGRSIPEAIELAAIADEAGIDALLLMPPYLVDGPPDGIFEYAKTIIQNTNLPVIYYNRGNGVLSGEKLKELADACPNLIGLKDGTGNIAELNITIKSIGDRLIYIGGVPTAEIIAEAYLAIGVNTYSSAVFNFVPELALHFYRSLRKGDTKDVKMITDEFYIPFVQLRSKKKGYAVSLIKAGATLIGKSAGNVRAPLVMPAKDETAELQKLIEKAGSILNT